MNHLLVLIKARITLFAAASAGAGFLLACERNAPIEWALLMWVLLGTSLAAAATGCLNQLMEIEIDSLMQRTKNRPLPRGQVSPAGALALGTACAAGGLLILYWKVNGLSCGLTAATLFSYLMIYTPLKQVSPIATWVGAIPGALPPLIGWAASTGRVSWEAWLLFGIQFFWQLPHFLALSWMYRKDYANAGIRVSSVTDPTGASVSLQMTLTTATLFALSLCAYAAGLAGTTYLVLALLLGIGFLDASRRAARSLSAATARRVFYISLAYLPGIFTALVVFRL